MHKLRTDDALRRQTEPIAIKPQRSLQIVNTESNDRDPWFHSRTNAPLWKCEIGYVSKREVSTFRGAPPRNGVRSVGTYPMSTIRGPSSSANAPSKLAHDFFRDGG